VRLKEILDKLTSYNIFNYLLPGIVFVVLAGKLTHYSLVQPDIVLGAFLYYFIGLVISRIGSLVIEPTLKKLSFVKFAAYKDFVTTAKNDPKLEILSESNNSYRTLSAMFLLLIALKIYEKGSGYLPRLAAWNAEIVVVLLLFMFLFAYRKQTRYITQRIEADKGMQEKETAKAMKGNL
jgi:hypothetical protein